MKNTDAQYTKGRYLDIHELEKGFNLSFSSYLIIRSKIIALDKIKKRLVVSTAGDEASQAFMIDLNSVNAVTLKKSYGSIKQGELKNKEVDDFLKRIDLQLAFSDGTETIILPFYEAGVDDRHDRRKLAKKAKHWQILLSGIAGARNEQKKVSTQQVQ